MLLIVAVIVVALLVGMALGGDFRTLSELKIRWWPLALVGLGLQLIPVPSMNGSVDHWLAVGLLVSSYVVLLAFVAVNFRLAGFAVIAAGFALNLLVISVNGGMPVTERAIRQAYGSRAPAEIQRLQEHGGAKHHLARDDDVLVSLSDVIPVGAPIHQVLSAGDVVFMVGVFWVIASATRGAAGRHRPGARRGSPVARDRARPAVDRG